MTKSQIIFNASKGEKISSLSEFKSLQKRIRGEFKVSLNKQDIRQEVLSDAVLLVLICPTEEFTESEFDELKTFLEKGGNILYMGNEGGETKNGSNFNYLLEECGLTVQDDAVCRSTYLKYFHPKEALILDGVLNREINRYSGKKPITGSQMSELIFHQTKGLSKFNAINSSSLSFVYPFGSTVSVEKPAVALLSSGSYSIPQNRAVCAYYQNPDSRLSGKIVVCGSHSMFNDEYIEKEENGKVFDMILKLLTSNEIELNKSDAADPDINEYFLVPNTPQMSEEPRGCLQEYDDIPIDFNDMLHLKMFSMDLSLVTESMQLYDKIGLVREPLSTIQPRFDAPLPPLNFAFFPPMLQEPPPPSLELFDLDEEFSSDKTRLAQLANKCSDEDLDYFLLECGRITGITSSLPQGKQSANHIMTEALRKLINWKMQIVGSSLTLEGNAHSNLTSTYRLLSDLEAKVS